MSHSNDPDQVIRIPRLTLQITILDAEERGYKKAQAEIARLREALEFYAAPDSWFDDNVTYVYNVIKYEDQQIPQGYELCDKHGGAKAREALNDLRKGGE